MCCGTAGKILKEDFATFRYPWMGAACGVSAVQQIMLVILLDTAGKV
jgi:hypothetical protein